MGSVIFVSGVPAIWARSFRWSGPPTMVSISTRGTLEGSSRITVVLTQSAGVVEALSNSGCVGFVSWSASALSSPIANIGMPRERLIAYSMRAEGMWCGGSVVASSWMSSAVSGPSWARCISPCCSRMDSALVVLRCSVSCCGCAVMSTGRRCFG